MSLVRHLRQTRQVSFSMAAPLSLTKARSFPPDSMKQERNTAETVLLFLRIFQSDQRIRKLITLPAGAVKLISPSFTS